MKKKKKNGPFRDLQKAGVGLAGLGVVTGVGGAIASRAPHGTPSVAQGFNTLAGFAPIAVTAVGGKTVLNQVRKIRPKRKKKSRSRIERMI